MGTGSLPGVESGRGVTLTPHPFLVPRSKNSRAIELPLISLRAFMAYEKGETYLLQIYDKNLRNFVYTYFIADLRHIRPHN
jgi:hypothetical protein